VEAEEAYTEAEVIEQGLRHKGGQTLEAWCHQLFELLDTSERGSVDSEAVHCLLLESNKGAWEKLQTRSLLDSIPDATTKDGGSVLQRGFVSMLLRTACAQDQSTRDRVVSAAVRGARYAMESSTPPRRSPALGDRVSVQSAISPPGSPRTSEISKAFSYADLEGLSLLTAPHLHTILSKLEGALGCGWSPADTLEAEYLTPPLNYEDGWEPKP